MYVCVHFDTQTKDLPTQLFLVRVLTVFHRLIEQVAERIHRQAVQQL